jgi:predicted molibdopterin-dependent oxidoreductase YjgC
MSTESLFTRLGPDEGTTVSITFNGAEYQVPTGSNVAAALLTAGVRRFRSTPVNGAPRAPYCMMGVCFECLVEIDGAPNCQSCLEPVRGGMVIRSQEGVRQVTRKSGDDSLASSSQQELL